MRIQKGDVALITGASRGLGVHIARALAERGAKLVLAARESDDLRKTSAAFEKAGAEVLTIPTDVADFAALERLVAATHAKFGGIDILVNNAGIEGAMHYEHRQPSEIARTIEVNLTAPMLLTRIALPGMIARNRGHIVNIASMAGLMGTPYNEPYSATKHGLVGFTRALRLTAQDMKWNVSASAICPGFMADAGMYEDMRRNYGVKAPALMGASPAEKMGPAVIRAIERDLPDLIVMPMSQRVSVAFSALMPRTVERVMTGMNIHGLFRATARQKLAAQESAT